MNRVHPSDKEQAEVHQVALTPATVAFQLVQQVRRQLLIGARQIVGNPHPPAGTAHQRGFDEVVRQDRPGKVALARQRRQRAVLNERLHADNGVVSPVVGLPQLPEVQTRRKQRTIHPGGKLLATRIQRVHARGARGRLNDPGIRVRFHQAHQAAQTLTGHHRVSVQHHHIAILAAPAAAEVIDVAALTLHSTTTAAVEDLPFALHFGNQLHPRLLLSHTDIGVIAIAEDIDVEMSGVTGRFHRLPGRPQAGENAVNVFVTDRHYQRRTVRRVQRFVTDRRGGNTVLIAADQ